MENKTYNEIADIEFIGEANKWIKIICDKIDKLEQEIELLKKRDVEDESEGE